jgi:hypothetical protein
MWEMFETHAVLRDLAEQDDGRAVLAALCYRLRAAGGVVGQLLASALEADFARTGDVARRVVELSSPPTQAELIETALEVVSMLDKEHARELVANVGCRLNGIDPTAPTEGASEASTVGKGVDSLLPPQ